MPPDSSLLQMLRRMRRLNRGKDPDASSSSEDDDYMKLEDEEFDDVSDPELNELRGGFDPRVYLDNRSTESPEAQSAGSQEEHEEEPSEEPMEGEVKESQAQASEDDEGDSDQNRSKNKIAAFFRKLFRRKRKELMEEEEEEDPPLRRDRRPATKPLGTATSTPLAPGRRRHRHRLGSIISKPPNPVIDEKIKAAKERRKSNLATGSQLY